jgi:hypothetical protein
MAAKTQSQREFVHLRQNNVPVRIHKQIVAHQKFMNLKSKTDVSIEEAAIDLWKRGIETMPHLNQ